MRRGTRYKIVREQQLMRCASAAGTAFCTSDAEAARPDGAARRRFASLFASLLVLAPMMTSAAWYWGG